MDEVPLRAGQTLFVPSGWIHAVHTPSEDTLVFGGNFLHRHSFEMQLRIHRLEGYMKVGPEYRFPNYQKLMWYAARDFLGECAEILRKEGWREEEDGDVDKEEDLQRDVVKCNDSTGEVHPGGLRRGIKRTVDGERAGEDPE